MQIYLASKSPRRKQLLQQINISCKIIDIDIDETRHVTEQPGLYVERLALEKAQSGLQKLESVADTIVIGADTAVVVDDQVLGKAESISDADRMLRLLSGRMHHVYSAVAIAGDNKMQEVKTSVTSVCFRVLTNSEITSYSQSEEALGKAGGYAIQGKASTFVQSIQGSYTGVVGLPLFETYELLLPYLD